MRNHNPSIKKNITCLFGVQASWKFDRPAPNLWAAHQKSYESEKVKQRRYPIEVLNGPHAATFGCSP
jgi:hypothetical protein